MAVTQDAFCDQIVSIITVRIHEDEKFEQTQKDKAFEIFLSFVKDNTSYETSITWLISTLNSYFVKYKSVMDRSSEICNLYATIGCYQSKVKEKNCSRKMDKFSEDKSRLENLMLGWFCYNESRRKNDRFLECHQKKGDQYCETCCNERWNHDRVLVRRAEKIKKKSPLFHRIVTESAFKAFSTYVSSKWSDKWATCSMRYIIYHI